MLKLQLLRKEKNKKILEKKHMMSFFCEMDYLRISIHKMCIYDWEEDISNITILKMDEYVDNEIFKFMEGSKVIERLENAKKHLYESILYKSIKRDILNINNLDIYWSKLGDFNPYYLGRMYSDPFIKRVGEYQFYEKYLIVNEKTIVEIYSDLDYVIESLKNIKSYCGYDENLYKKELTHFINKSRLIFRIGYLRYLSEDYMYKFYKFYINRFFKKYEDHYWSHPGDYYTELF